MSIHSPAKHFIFTTNNSASDLDIMPGSAQHHAFEYGYAVIYLCPGAKLSQRVSLFLDKHKDSIIYSTDTTTDIETFTERGKILVCGVHKIADDSLIATLKNKIEKDSNIYLCIDDTSNANQLATILGMDTAEKALELNNRIGIKVSTPTRFRLQHKRLFDIFMTIDGTETLSDEDKD